MKISKPFILGLGGFLHDGNIALLNTDGEIEHASQIERFNRQKHSGIDDPKEVIALLQKRIRNDIFEHIEHIVWVDQYLFNRGEKKQDAIKWVKSLNCEVTTVDHHMAHLASAFYNSPFDKATLLSLDGKGDGCSAKIAIGEDNKITELNSIPMQYSVGRIWNALNTVVGFPGYQNAGKTMALASFGNPVYLSQLLKHVEFLQDGTFFFHLGDGIENETSRSFFFNQPNLIDLLCKIANVPIKGKFDGLDQKYADLSSSVQEFTNTLALRLVENAIKTTNCRNLCLAGGVALNGNMNKKILDSGMIDEIFIQPAASDMGLALGGAQYKFYNDLGNSRSYIPFSPYLGHNIETEPVEDILKNSGLNYIKSENITEDASQFIADGKIVAWVQGKEEFGPRALGNRSILVSPLISSMKDDLNLRVKHRESIRPFAGAIPVENCNKYFEIEKESPHMLLIAQVREEFKELLRPIVHVDGSIRLQTVTEQMNSKFYNLLKSFGAKTGTPVILNTSLNDNGEPIVSTVEDAIVFFRKNSIDYLIISNFIITNPV